MVKNNRKGNIAFIGIAGLIALALIVVVFAGGTSANVESLSPTAPGCNPKPLGVRVSGVFVVEDKNSWLPVMKLAPQQIEVWEVKSYNKLGIFDKKYDWRVCAINPSNNNRVFCDKGKASFPYLGTVTQSHEFSVDFTVPDSNCNGYFDEEFDIIIEADIGEDPIRERLSFRDGKWSVRG